MSLGLLYDLLGEVSIQVLYPFFNWVVCLPGVGHVSTLYIWEIKPLTEVSNITCCSLLACSIFVEKSASSLIGPPLYVTFCFSLAAFKILSLSLNFAILNYDVLWSGSLWVHPVWDPMCFLDLCDS